MRSRISIRGCVRPSVRRSDRPSVRPSVRWSVTHKLKSCKSAVFCPKLLIVRAWTHLMPCIRPCYKSCGDEVLSSFIPWDFAVIPSFKSRGFPVRCTLGWNCIESTRSFCRQKTFFPWAPEREGERPSSAELANEWAVRASKKWANGVANGHVLSTWFIYGTKNNGGYYQNLTKIDALMALKRWIGLMPLWKIFLINLKTHPTLWENRGTIAYSAEADTHCNMHHTN